MPNIDENEVLRDALSSLNEDAPPMPEGLHAAWMQKVEDDMNETRTEKTRTSKTITRFLSIAAAMVFVIGGTLLTRNDLSSLTNGSSEDGSAAMTYGAAIANSSKQYAMDEAVEEEAAMKDSVMLTMARGASNSSTITAPTIQQAQTDKKIIRSASLTIATQTFEDSLATLKADCEEQGGWIESSSENVNSYSGLRTAYLTLRIPQTGLDAYLADTETLGRITSRSESAEDVTESYQDTTTRLNTQLALMERLQALITESADLSDLLALESQIADTQYQIDRLQSSLNSTDRQVTYSTVNVTLKEEKTVELTDESVSFGERIASALQVGLSTLVGFIGDMAVFLVAAAPFLAIVLIVVIVIRVIMKRRK